MTFLRTPPPPRPAWAEGIDPSSFGFQLPPAPKKLRDRGTGAASGARVNHFEEKAAFVPTPDLYGFATAPTDQNDAVNKADVIDLTSKVRPDGTLDWTPPPGHWVVLRFGYSLLGITNHPATAEATGLEVDKLNGQDVRRVHGEVSRQLQGDNRAGDDGASGGFATSSTTVGKRDRRTGPTT